MDLTKIRKVLGWCAVLNIGFMSFSWFYFLALHDVGYRIFTEVFDLFITMDAYDAIAAGTLGFWKILVFTLFVIPWFAIKMVEK